MTNDEYRELVEFLGVRFDGIEQRLTRVEVLGEENRGLIQTVAEGVTSTNRRIDELRSDMDARFTDVDSRFEALTSEIHAGFRDQREAFGTWHGEFGVRLGRLERRVDRLEEEAS